MEHGRCAPRKRAPTGRSGLAHGKGRLLGDRDLRTQRGACRSGEQAIDRNVELEGSVFIPQLYFPKAIAAGIITAKGMVSAVITDSTEPLAVTIGFRWFLHSRVSHGVTPLPCYGCFAGSPLSGNKAIFTPFQATAMESNTFVSLPKRAQTKVLSPRYSLTPSSNPEAGASPSAGIGSSATPPAVGRRKTRCCGHGAGRA